jgi:hypothetical protein
MLGRIRAERWPRATPCCDPWHWHDGGVSALPPTPPLSYSGLLRVQRAWARQLAVPLEALTIHGSHVFSRTDATAVTVVHLSGSWVVAGPTRAVALLERLGPGSLGSLDSLTAALKPLHARPLGTASLSYRDASLDPVRSLRTCPATPTMLEELRAALPLREWDECGLADMAHRWAALTPAGQVAAVAGYEKWGADIAHIGVSSTPGNRGRGYAAAAAQQAVAAALRDGLVAQWRCRTGNTPSERLAESLRFATLGSQNTMLLDA